MLVDAAGERRQVESTIVSTVRVKTSVDWERRYKVWLTLTHRGVKRRVKATLNDRAHMEYPLLVGRNFLSGRFLVDVAVPHSADTVEESEEADPEPAATGG